MDWLQSIIYGFVMGFSELIPVSSSAQNLILRQLFGASENDAFRELLIHIFSLSAFIFAWRGSLKVFQDRRYIARSRRGRSVVDYNRNSDSRFVRAAVFPMLMVMIISLNFNNGNNLIRTAILLIVNGIVLYIPERILQGNKSARSMSSMDAWLVGIFSAVSVIPGFSRIGMGIAISQIRGADRKNALNWAYMLSIPALMLLIAGDLVTIIFSGQGIVFSTGFGGYLLISIFAFVGSYLAVYLMRSLILLRGLLAFAYYSWGAALFLFILYLL
jgi:undecaprenyl-diphosphatase